MKRMFSIALAIMLLCASMEAGGEDAWRYVSDYSSVAELKTAGLAKAQQVEEEGIVLLKNDNDLLPLAEETVVSLFGVTAIDPVYGGTGSGAVETDSVANFVQSFEQAGLPVENTDLIEWYTEESADSNVGRSAYAIGEAKWSKVKKHLGDDYSQVNGSAAFFVIGRVGGEGSDMTNGAGKEDSGADGSDYLTLNEDEISVLQGLKALKDEGIITSITVIINSANPLSSAFLFDDEYGVDAALWVGSLGQTGVYAVGRVISGAVNPSGSLPDTWWMNNMNNPVMNNFGAQIYENTEEFFGSGSNYPYTRYVVYQEGIYVGYRYTQTRWEDDSDFDYESTVAFPFGWGMSYTEFEVSDMQVDKAGEGNHAAYQVTVSVTNTGNASGCKTVQVYARKPYTEYDRENLIEKATVELVGFGKTGLLAPGESEQVVVNVPEYYLTSYDAENSEVFVLDEGIYGLVCADNAHDAAVRACAAEGEPEAGKFAMSENDHLVWLIGQEFDDETYAASYGTGSDVASLFYYADMNRYDGAEDNEITWYTRSDWEGSITDGPVELAMTDLMVTDMMLDDGDLDEDGEFPVMGQDHGLMLIDLLEADEDDPLWDEFMDQLTFEELELVCTTGLRETAAVQRIGKPYTLDHNGPTGVTQKYNSMPAVNGLALKNDDPDASLSGTCYPCNGILAATFNSELIGEVGELVGQDAMWAGYSGIYGTGLNLHRSAYAGRVFEYFSEDPVLSGMMGAAWSAGVQSKGVYVYSKHLALNEQEENRAGISTWCTEQALRELYLRPFEIAIVDGGALCVMSAFNRIGPIWCGSSTELLTDWLRGEVGLKGFVITDMYDYSYMVMANALVAGNDLPDGELLKNGCSISAYAENGETPNAAVVQAMRISAKRILYTVLHSRAMDGMTAGE